jgi:hypothetical protein
MGQGPQVVEPSGEKVPAAHFTGALLPPLHVYPAGHLLPSAIPCLGQYVPGGHTLPSVIPGIGQYFPITH